MVKGMDHWLLQAARTANSNGREPDLGELKSLKW